MELLATPRPSSAVDLVLHRLPQAQALAALTANAAERARVGEFAGAVLVARHGKVLLNDAWGRADRTAGIANTPATRFRIGSMNKMFTAVATLQLVEAHKLRLDDPIGKHLPGYPNKQVAAKVTVRHLLTHSGGTGDIFGPEFDQHRPQLREHRDYLKLYGPRGSPTSRVPALRTPTTALSCSAPSSNRSAGCPITTTLTTTSSTRLACSPRGRFRKRWRSRTGRSGTSGFPFWWWVCRIPTPCPGGAAAGGGYSTVGDLLRFAQALDSGTLLSEATLAEATRPHHSSTATVNARPGGQLRARGGGAHEREPGLRAGYVVVSLSNLDPPAASELVEFFTRRAGPAARCPVLRAQTPATVYAPEVELEVDLRAWGHDQALYRAVAAVHLSRWWSVAELI